MTLLKSIAGDAYPETYSHRYPVKLAGTDEYHFDGIGYVEFEDRAAFERLVEITGREGNKERLEDDEAKFLDKAKIQMYFEEW